MAENPGLHLADGSVRGYLRLELTPSRLQADMVAMDTVFETESARRTLASFVVEDGRPGATPA